MQHLFIRPKYDTALFACAPVRMASAIQETLRAVARGAPNGGGDP